MKPRPHARKRSSKRRVSKRKQPRKRARKTTAQSTGLIPQPHGGALKPGGTPGNAGGTGRPPSQIRAALAHSFDERRYIYEKIADNKRGKVRDRLAALDSMGKFGLGDKPLEVADIRQHPDAMRFMNAYRTALTSELSPEVAERVTARVDALLQDPGEK